MKHTRTKRSQVIPALVAMALLTTAQVSRADEAALANGTTMAPVDMGQTQAVMPTATGTTTTGGTSGYAAPVTAGTAGVAAQTARGAQGGQAAGAIVGGVVTVGFGYKCAVGDPSTKSWACPLAVAAGAATLFMSSAARGSGNSASTLSTSGANGAGTTSTTAPNQGSTSITGGNNTSGNSSSSSSLSSASLSRSASDLTERRQTCRRSRLRNRWQLQALARAISSRCKTPLPKRLRKLKTRSKVFRWRLKVERAVAAQWAGPWVVVAAAELAVTALMVLGSERVPAAPESSRKFLAFRKNLALTTSAWRATTFLRWFMCATNSTTPRMVLRKTDFVFLVLATFHDGAWKDN